VSEENTGNCWEQEKMKEGENGGGGTANLEIIATITITVIQRHSS
jgi:hypothetical protein